MESLLLSRRIFRGIGSGNCTVIATLGLFFFDPGNFLPLNQSGQSSFSAITATVALTLWAFLGLESAIIPAGDVRDPKRTIPRATIIGTAVAALVYIFGTVAVMGVLSPAELAASKAPYADAGRTMWGRFRRWPRN